jgi:hypothetical protein
MADQERRNPLSTIESVGMAALAVGAGAALLYRGGGARFLADGVEKTSKLLHTISNDVAGFALKDFDSATIGGLYRDHISGPNSTWRELGERAANSATLRLDSPHSFANAFKTSLQINENPLMVLSKKYDEDMIKTPMKTVFGERYADRGAQHSINTFVNDFVDHQSSATNMVDDLGNNLYNKEFVDKHFKDATFSADEQNQMMNELLGAVKQKQQNLSGFMQSHSAIMNQAAEKLTDINEVTTKFGRRGQESFFDNMLNTMLGDRKGTLGDIVEAVDSGALTLNNNNMYASNGSNIVTKDIVDGFRELINKDSNFSDVYMDNALRVKVNTDGAKEFYSFAETARLKDKFLDEMANTLPGKLGKMRDVLYTKNAPNMAYFGKGKADPFLAAIEGNNSVLTDNSYMRIFDKSYKMTEGGLEHITELDGHYITSGKHGTMPRLSKYMAGIADRVKAGNKVFEALDMFTSPNPTKFKQFKSIFTKTKDPKWARNLADTFLFANTDEFTHGLQNAEYIQDYFNRVTKMNRFFNETTSNMNKKTIAKLHSAATGRSKDYLSLLGLKDDELINTIMQRHGEFDTNRMLNSDLVSLVKRYRKDSTGALASMSITSDKDAILSTTKAVKFHDMLRKEISKEALLTHVSARQNNYDALSSLFRDAGLEGQALKETKYLANWAVFQQQSGSFSSKIGDSPISELAESMQRTQTLFTGARIEGQGSTDSEFLQSFRQNIRTMVKEKAPITQRGFIDETEVDMINGHTFGEHMYIKKAINPLDLIKNINNANTWKAFGKQFTAGRNNMKDVTTATFFPYFGLMRLMDPLSELGLAFSSKSTGSVGDIAWNIMTRRAAPIAGAITALSYIDYEMNNFTGTGLRGALANTTASLDILNRKVADSIGLGGVLKDARAINPMMQYTFGSEYQNAEERKKYYEDGYAPVRKGRYWSFGSTSEFRGGKIDYWQPNYARRANSDWHDVGVYGSAEEKWKHSLIPTLRHPLSTLNYLANPYWLEKKNYWDRPYPLTGKMFEEGTPWGAVLNPTIGELIKPQKRMHQQELGNSMMDVRTLIAHRNAAIKDRATQDDDLVKFTQAGMIEPLKYTPMAYADPSQVVMNLKLSRGDLTQVGMPGADYSSTLSDISNYDQVHQEFEYSGAQATQPTGLSFGDRVSMGAQKGGVVSGVARGFMAGSSLELIAPLNRSAKMTAATNRSNGVMVSDIYRGRVTGGIDALDSDTINEMRNITSTKDYLNDAFYSTKELGGMYGFMFDEIMPGGKSKRLQQAGRMSSYGRQFWDASIGGLGGELMEISRRFFPHEDHSRESVNTIRNLMPEWMPTRFKTGDPFEMIPKGEMRLPGAGYETLNKLHPDEFGRYGAYDRMKILADVSPYSPEYKIWKSVAGKSTEDPLLKEEMKAIDKRAKLQGKGHDFYQYKFSQDTELISKTAVVSEILSDKGFKVVGDERTYRLAGVNVKSEKEGEGLNKYLQAGEKVTLKYGESAYNRGGADGSISTIIMKGGENLNRTLLKTGAGEEKEDTTAAGLRARFTQNQIDKGRIYEKIAHAPIPFIHNKFMRVESPLESYKNEQVYGTAYATWSHPIEGFIRPAFEKAWSYGPVAQAVGLAAAVASNKMVKSEAPVGLKIAANLAYGLTNPGAFAGGIAGYIARLDGKYIRKASNIGAAISLTGFAVTKLDNPLYSAANFAIVGGYLANQLKVSGVGGAKGALLGALTGVALSGLKNPRFDKEKMFGPYVPGRIRDKRELEEYFDRITYVKYMGLYEKASRQALMHEGVNIKKIVNKYEADVAKREKIKSELLESKQDMSNTYAEGDTRRDAIVDKIDEKLLALTVPTQTLRAGKYARSALAYKQAAESTIYGLKENATWAQLARAVPKYERDYMMEFIKEKDPSKREDILSYISPYERKILQIAWGQKPDSIDSNTDYFAHMKLPGAMWGGWKPNVNMDNVKMKTIENEGMMLSDFGYYESQKESADYQDASSLDMNQGSTDPIALRANLLTTMNGAGLFGVDVSIEPSSQPGIQMIANVIRTTDYELKQKLNGALGRMFY